MMPPALCPTPRKATARPQRPGGSACPRRSGGVKAWAQALLWLLALALPLQGMAAGRARIHTAAHVHAPHSPQLPQVPQVHHAPHGPQGEGQASMQAALTGSAAVAWPAPASAEALRAPAWTAALAQAWHRALGHAHAHDHPHDHANTAARPGHWASSLALRHDHRGVGHHPHAAADPSVVHLEAAPHPLHDRPGGAGKRLVGDVDTPPTAGRKLPRPRPGQAWAPRAERLPAAPPPSRLERPPKGPALS